MPLSEEKKLIAEVAALKQLKKQVKYVVLNVVFNGSQRISSESKRCH
jgi:hypothetical protein